LRTARALVEELLKRIEASNISLHTSRPLSGALAEGGLTEKGRSIYVRMADGARASASTGPSESTSSEGRARKSPLEKAGLPRVRVHDLRHAAASLYLARGENPKVVQELLGHSTIAVTMDISTPTSRLPSTPPRRAECRLCSPTVEEVHPGCCQNCCQNAVLGHLTASGEWKV
jgi:integrase